MNITNREELQERYRVTMDSDFSEFPALGDKTKLDFMTEEQREVEIKRRGIPQWYRDAGYPLDADLLQTTKQKAEKCYAEGEYDQSRDLYLKALTLMASRDNATWRDICTGLSLAYLAVGNKEWALMRSLFLFSTNVTVDHYIASWLLLAKIYKASNHNWDEENMLQSLVTFFPTNADYWLMLAECQISMMRLCVNYGKKVLAVTFFYRAMFLMKSVEKNVKHVDENHYPNIYKKMLDTIEGIDLPQEKKDLIKELIKVDVYKKRVQRTDAENKALLKNLPTQYEFKHLWVPRVLFPPRPY